MSLDDTGVSVPTHSRPTATTESELRHEVESLMGRLLHLEHVADKRAESGDAHNREHWRVVAATHRADAEAVAQVLGIAAVA